MSELFGGIDAGGTTFKCGIMDGEERWLARRRITTTTPERTLAECADFFARSGFALRALGVASFGPIDVDPDSPGYGTIQLTPKPQWSGVNLRRVLAEALRVPVVVDTDVNGALLAEMTDGAAAGARTAAFITVGTGIGAGIVSHGQWLARPAHPEFGHIPVQPHPRDSGFTGSCPFHGSCLEGMASVTALSARFGPPLDWPDAHPGWEVAADYLAQACLSLCLTLRPDRIVVGGGLMLAPHMLARLRTAFDDRMNRYLGAASPTGATLIHTPGHGDDAGLYGAVLLGRQGRPE